MGEIPATYSCANGWGPFHVLVKGPVTGHDRWGPVRDESKDRTLCGIKPTSMWERTRVRPGLIQCKRCKAMLEKQGRLDRYSRLLPMDVRDRLTPLCEQKDEDPIVHARWFESRIGWSWYATEGSQEDDDWMLFGLVKGFVEELGYFTLSQLESFGAQLDGYFEPRPLSEVR